MIDARKQHWEKYWQELRHHLEWTQGFGVYFYFSDHTELLSFLQNRLQQFLIGRTTRLQIIEYDSKDPEWVETTLNSLLSRDKKWQLLHAPVWIDLTTDNGEQAQKDYFTLLSRLNERRDSLRKYYQSPVIFCIPFIFQNNSRLAAPDLWSVRDFSESIPIADSDTNTKNNQGSTYFSEREENNCAKASKHQQAIIEEWERLENTNKNDIGTLRSSQRASRELLKLGWLKDASKVAQKSLEIAKMLGKTPSSPESLRDLLVSLNMVGQVAQQQGRWNDAHENYKESLDIRRRLSEMLGETPESLRDLSVSLYNLGCVYEGQEDRVKALAIFEEGFEIGKRLAEMQVGIPSFTEMVSYFQKKLDSVFLQADN